jgi:hypothetical protein
MWSTSLQGVKECWKTVGKDLMEGGGGEKLVGWQTYSKSHADLNRVDFFIQPHSGASGFAFCVCGNVLLGAPFPNSGAFSLTLHVLLPSRP